MIAEARLMRRGLTVIAPSQHQLVANLGLPIEHLADLTADGLQDVTTRASSV